MIGGFSKWFGNYFGKIVKFSFKKDIKFNYCIDLGY